MAVTDVWDIAKYVEGHPENQGQRWRLAKKLYKENEFRLAVEHLLVLKNEWPDRSNVIRYLAATYHRLQRYDDAARELQRALEKWPKDAGLYEQLAHTLQVSGRLEEAADTWEKLASRQPDHPLARKSAARIRETILSGSRHDYDDAEMPMPRESMADTEKILCVICGVENAPELERCWQCKAPLKTGETSAFLVRQSRASNYSLEGVFYGVAAVLGVAGIVLTALYGPWPSRGGLGADGPSYSFARFLRGEVGPTRVYVGLLLLVAWPLVFNFCLSLTEYDPRKASPLGAGLLVATITYLATWIPSAGFWLAPLVGLGASVGCAIWALGLVGAGRIARVAVLQAVAMSILVVTLFSALHGFRFVPEIPAIARFSATHKTIVPAEYTGETPIRLAFRYRGTPSRWINAHGGRGELEVVSHGGDSQITVEIKDGEESKYYGNVGPDPARIALPPLLPDRDYLLTLDDIRGRGGIPLGLKITGILQPVLEPAE